MATETRRAELRQEGGRRLSGTAIRYGDVAQLPWGRERIEARAFAPIGDVLLNGYHDRTTPLARTGAGLTLADSDSELSMRADLPETQGASDVLALVRAGVLRGLSIEFRATQERNEGDLRIIERAELVGVGVVDSPAYPASTVEARRRGPRRTWIRGGVRYGVEAICDCLQGDCNKVVFRPKALEVLPGSDVVATVGRMTEAVGSTKGTTLRIRETAREMQWELDQAARDTMAGRQLTDLAQARVEIYGRPLIDDARSQFTEAGQVRTYTQAAMTALLLKPIAGDESRREGWDPVTIDAAAAPARKREAPRRRRVWL